MSVRAKTYFDAEQVLNTGICSGDSETLEFFHCTPAKNIPLIMKQGLKPGKGESFGTESHSAGKVFLAAGMEEALMWQSFLEDVSSAQIAILRLFLGSNEVKRLKVDTLAWDDGSQCSFYFEGTIPSSKIEIETLYGEKRNSEAESTAVESVTHSFANILEDLASSEDPLARYRRIRKSSPVVWKAAQRRARLITNALKKNRMAVTVLLPFMRLVKQEIALNSFAEPTKENVQDALRAVILDEQERQKAFRLYDQVMRLHSMFRSSQHRTTPKKK